ncbi:hypothetical protein NBRC10513_000333 [Rhodotorula toruloides]|uniref:Uncharacterized protein n=1 Tax=Rhodotorula toruloides TaxID=5286 RepID=A0A2T0A9B3_RHOTO|nr:hypothetical protein AAT19DRAFT_14968 [Rhodotorula toruloides]
MPPRRRYPRKEKKEKPVIFGPEPPPKEPAAPPEQRPNATEGETATQDQEQEQPNDPSGVPHVDGGAGGGGGGGRGRRRKKLPRKKFNKDSRGGWEDDHVERDPHPEDKGRYEPSLPWDLRLLRCCDEFRSLRSLGQLPYKVNYQNVLRYFQVDIVALREKYGMQSLRGYDPDDFDDDAGGEDGDDEDDGDEAKEATVEEVVEKTEDEWAETVFSLQRLAIFFNNRTNDGYVPSLWLAPIVMKSFLKFMLIRKVFPGRKKAIDACIAMCNTARAQLHPAHLLLKQAVNVSTLGPAMRVLFSEADSVLPSPIVDRPDPVKQLTDPLPDVFSAMSIVDDADSDDELGAEVVSPPEMPTWEQAKQAKQDKEEKEPDDPEERTRRRIAGLKERFEREAKAMEAWQKCGRNERTSTSVLKDALVKVRGEKEVEGEWKVGYRERSGRSLVGWEVVYKGKAAPVAAEGDASEQQQAEEEDHMLVKVELSPHQRDFPVTDALFFPSISTQDALARLGNGDSILSHNLDEPLTVLLDVSPSFDLKHLDALRSSILEADLTQLALVPTPPNDTIETLWIVDRLWRVIPSYWQHAGELLREEPGRVMSHPGGYGPSPQEALAKIEEELEAEEAERARTGGTMGGERPAQMEEEEEQEKIVEVA